MSSKNVKNLLFAEFARVSKALGSGNRLELLEFLAQAAMWGWIGQAVPTRVRGRFLAWRNTVGVVFAIPTMLLGARFLQVWQQSRSDWPLGGYAWLCGFGLLFFSVSVVVLAFVPKPPKRKQDKTSLSQPVTHLSQSKRHASAWELLRDHDFCWFVAYGCVASMANGLTQAAQNIYPKQLLKVSAETAIWLRTAMMMGQAAYGPPAGWFADRIGNRPVMLASQAITAVALLGFVFASSADVWPLWGMWLAWSAFAGINVCGPNLCLRLAQPELRSRAAALYFGLTGLSYGLATVAGGVLHDRLFAGGPTPHSSPRVTLMYHGLFLAGMMLRLASLIPLFFVRETERAAA